VLLLLIFAVVADQVLRVYEAAASASPSRVGG